MHKGVKRFLRKILIPSNTNTLTQIIKILTPEDLLAQNRRKVIQMPYLSVKIFQNMYFIPEAQKVSEAKQNIMQGQLLNY